MFDFFYRSKNFGKQVGVMLGTWLGVGEEIGKWKEESRVRVGAWEQGNQGRNSGTRIFLLSLHVTLSLSLFRSLSLSLSDRFFTHISIEHTT